MYETCPCRHPELMQFTARVTLPRLDEARVVSGLRSDLREQIAPHWRVPDWSTLTVGGPVAVTGDRGRTRYRWTAAVEPR